MDVNVKDVQLDKNRYGHVLESFVFGELLKHTTTANTGYSHSIVTSHPRLP
jgi:hypothetical protein